ATRGDSLALCRASTSASGFAGAKFDVGAYQREEIALTEVDAQGRRRRGEVFAADRLGDAVARLYERYAALLPDGPARTRAAATARSVAAWNGLIDPERLATVMAPSIDCVDHRSLHTWSARGAEEVLGHWRGQIDLAAGFAVRDDDVVALAPDASLVRQTYSCNVLATD